MDGRTEYRQLSFVVPQNNTEAYSETDGKKGFEINVDDGAVSVNVYYDFNEKPLTMQGKAKPGDTAAIKLISYRLELLINDKVVDEEWPAGNCRYKPGDTIISEFPIDISEGEYVEDEQPVVIGTFQNAEGWKPDENVFVGDCMAHVHDGRFHVIYLKDRHRHASKWGNGGHQWAHISTDDFVNWQIHPMVVTIDNPKEASICTGSWVEKDGIQYLFYSVRATDGGASVMRRSISTDGYHYKKDENFGFTLSDKYNTAAERDPNIILDENGLYHMLVTTTCAPGVGCLAHLTSSNLDEWEEKGHYFEINDFEPECPDYFKFGDYYYITYNLGGKCHYKYSKEPFSGWQEPENPLIDCGTVPKCAVWNDKIVFVGFEKTGNYAGTLTFKAATVNDKHELVFVNCQSLSEV